MVEQLRSPFRVGTPYFPFLSCSILARSLPLSLTFMTAGGETFFIIYLEDNMSIIILGITFVVSFLLLVGVGVVGAAVGLAIGLAIEFLWLRR